MDDLKSKAEQYTKELEIAKRHAAQLAKLDPSARQRVRACIDSLLGERPAENGAAR